jgi:hypothetical protein
VPSGNIYAWGNRSPATKDQYLDAIYGAHVRVGSISFEEACPTIPRNNLLETYMQPCDACCDLVGKPSSAPPHGDLAASGVIAVGPPGNMTKVSSSWNCTVCGNWMYQNTADGDPPNEWAIGERPADWPAK